MKRQPVAMLLPVLAAVSSFAQTNVTITVDPTNTFTGTWAVEWSTDGDFEGWSPVNATASVTNGLLQGVATTTDSRVQLSAFAGGPDLDLGTNDFLEIRIQVPTNYAGSIQIFYGTTLTTGFSGARVVTIPAALIPADGNFHVYRLELGLEVYWRSTLRDLRVDPVDGAGTTGMEFAVDYIRIGDSPGAFVYQPRYTTECPAAGGATPAAALFGPGQAAYSMESKHFRFLWNDAVAAHGSWTATMPHNTLRNAEEVWQILCRKLGYREPCFAVGTTSGARYKVNITSWHSGYWEGLDGSYGRLNITPDGLRENPPTTVLPHEFTHVIQSHNTSGYVPGSWWEGHANYGRERYLQHFGVLYSSNQRSGIDPTYLRCAHQILAHGRDYYLSWPMFMYLDENPDGLPDLGEGTNVKLWQQTQVNEYPLMALERLTPVSSLKDIVGGFARRGATYNYASKTDIQSALAGFGQPLDNAATVRWQFTDLVQRTDDPGWWRVPFEMAPMQGAYAIHELVPIGSGTGRVVSVNFHGLPNAARGADWRASFIVIDDSGAERYSTLWGSGTNSVTLSATENKVYLAVAGAPATFYTGASSTGFQGDFDEPTYPYRSWPSKTRFPYEIQVTGATPKQRDNGSTAGLIQHANGGGWKASTASVAAGVYLGPNARVLNTANVSGTARIEDYAVVSGNAVVSGSAIISGHAWVRGGTVTGNAKVRDWALVEGGTISGSARVLEHANIKGGLVTDIATAKGTAGSLSGTLAGNAMIDGDYGDFFSGRSLTNRIAFGHLPYVGVPDNYTHILPTGIYAAYDFAAAHDSRILDQYGVTDSFHQGNPVWYSSDGRRVGFLAFNGVNKYVVLDRSLCDLRQITVAAWVKWSGGVSNQPVWYLGAATNKCMFLTPDDGAGHVAFTLINGGASQTLAASNPLSVGVWTHVAVTLDGTNAALYVNGIPAASGANTNRPDQLLAANTATALQHNYLARGATNSLPFFQGALDGVQFYATALSAGEVASLVAPASPGTLYVDLRATNAASGATVFTTWTNLGVSVGNFTRSGSPSYSTNVTGTQIPGVQLNGINTFYSSANMSIADVTGASDRTIEVWAFNPTLATEETMVSLGNRSGTRVDCAFNFGTATGWGAVTHFNDDVPWGTPPSSNAWHHLVYVYDGTTNVQLYVDGAAWLSDTLAGALVTPTTDPVNIGCQRASAGGGAASQLFSGYINAVRVWGGAMTPSQAAANYSLGPWVSPAPQVITFAPISNVTVNAGVTLNVTNSATDPNQPPLPLTFSILSAPSNATINASSGLFTWRPAVVQADTTNGITLKVQNSATPGLSATQSFVAKVNALATPSLTNALLSNGLFGFQVNGGLGPDYLIQTSTNLSDWVTLLNTNPVVLPFFWADTNAPANAARFYRVWLLP